MSNGDDFNIRSGPDGTFISIDSTRIEECMRLFQEQKMTAIHISSLGRYKAGDLEFLKNYSDIVHAVLVSDGTGIDVSGLAHLERLEYLTLYDFAKPVRLPELKGLKRFAGRWSPELELGPDCRELEQVLIHHFNGKDLQAFPELPSLRKLDLVQARLKTLDGIERLKEPEELILHRCSKLEDLTALMRLTGCSLRRISLEYCRKIQSYEPLGRLPWLNTLNISFCHDLPNLDFLEGCSELTGFGFYGTKLLTDDVSPLTKLPKLTFVGFSAQRNLRHQKKWIADLLDSKKMG